MKLRRIRAQPRHLGQPLHGILMLPEQTRHPLLASATLDRLAHHVHQIVITVDSFRACGRRRGDDQSRRDRDRDGRHE